MLVLESYFRHQQLYYSTRFLVLFSKKKKKPSSDWVWHNLFPKDKIHLIVLSPIEQRGGGELQDCVGRGQSNSRVCVCVSWKTQFHL